MKVWVVRFDEDVKDFVAQKVFPSISDNSFDFPVILNPPRPLWLVTKEQGLQKVEHYDVAESVRDGNRQQAAFWGGLFPTLDRRRLRRITLSRLFFNFGLMPYFKYVWNVDKVFFDGNEIFVMEIKHKFPYASRGKLKFGINNGELKNMLKFASVGMRNVHLVIVKPVRKKDYSTQILFTDGNHIRNTAVIAREVSEQEARGTLMSKGGTSAAHTSLEGKTSQPYKAFDADTFAVIGMKSDDGNELGSHLVEMLSGKETKRCTDAFLNGLQMFV
jgi:hypothetical protein